MITEAKWRRLRRWMLQLNIEEADLNEKFIIGSGRGGQKIQKSATCVFISHAPSNTTIKCQRTRSREDNRYFARKRLCEKIDEHLNQKKSLQKQAQEKRRRQKKRRSRRSKQRMLDDKHRNASVKKNRQNPLRDSNND